MRPRVPAVVLAVLFGGAAVLAAPALRAPRCALADDAPAAGDAEGGAEGKKEPPKVEIGAEAPDFTLKDQDGSDVALSSYRGKKNVVVAFYPQAFSAGCTREMKCLTSEWRKVEERGAEILAISGDPVAECKKFAVAVGTRFPLLSDSGFAVAKTYGVYTPSPTGGFAARSVFLVDREGKLRWMRKDYAVPKTLEGTDLLAQLDLLRPETSDPAESLASLPSPEREAKTALVRYVQALLAEDVRAVDGLLHKDLGAKPGWSPAMVAQRRQAELDRHRKLFEAADLKKVPFGDVLDLRAVTVFAKGDHEKPGALAGYTEDARKGVEALAEGELAVVARTKTLKAGEQTVVPRELLLVLRRQGDDWRIVGFGGR